MKDEANKKNIEYFNNLYVNYKDGDIVYDNWLDKFYPEMDKVNMAAIDLGCGLGNNTKYLLDKGKKVIPCDASFEAVRRVEERFNVRGNCFDMLEPFPLVNGSADLVVADLSLHYFTREDTIKILKEIKRILVSNGDLVARVNSIENIKNNPNLGKEIEHNLYMTSDGRYKRFFDDKDIYDIFNVLEVKRVWKSSMERYNIPKEVYMVRAKKRG